MKKIFGATLLLVSAFCISCEKTPDRILIRFQNDLRQDISEAYYDFNPEGKTYIGLLPAHSKTAYVPFDSFEVGSGMPMGLLKGAINQSAITASCFSFCGTGINYAQLEPGKYTLIVTEVTYGKTPIYQLKFAN